MGDATFIVRSRSRRQRRDRVAHQIAMTITTAMLLLVTGGVWWLFSSPVERDNAAGIDRLLVLQPPLGPREHAGADPKAEHPAPAHDPSVHAVPQMKLDAGPPSGPVFNGRPLRKARTIRMLVTAYSPDARSCGKWADNITASGYSVWTNAMRLVAADTRILPFGTIISIPGYDGGEPVPVLDRGGAIKGRRLDVLFPTHEIALQWGKRWVDVTVWEYQHP